MNMKQAAVKSLDYFYTVKVEATCCSETSIGFQRTALRYMSGTTYGVK
jgi:hypothetical protein